MPATFATAPTTLSNGRASTAPATPYKIACEDVRKTYRGRGGEVLALDNVSLNIEEGEFVCLVGPSGCGKSTLCNMVAGFDTPSQGRILLDGQEVRGPSASRAMMFQEPALFPWMNARENVAFGLKQQGLNKADRNAKAEEYLRLVRLAGFGESQPHELSGGMRQRVALARALAVEPQILLMDEPFAALDAQTRDHMLEELERIWRETRKTILFVTHNVREAVILGTRICVFTARPGHIKREFNLEELSYPRRSTEPMVAETMAHVQSALRDEVAKTEAGEYRAS